MASFVPIWLEDFKHVNTMKPKIPFNIILAKSQIDWIYEKSWLKLNYLPTVQEQGKPPKYALGVAGLLWNRNQDVLKGGK